MAPVIGHRGAAASAPENTLAGLRRAHRLGCRWIEFDVRLTAESAIILCHDGRLDRTTDRKGRISALPLSAIRECDAGSWFGPDFAGERVPTLEEALALAAELGLGANIELKADRGRAPATGTAVGALLAHHAGLGRRLPPLLVSSFLPEALVALGEVDLSLARGLLVRTVPRGWVKFAREFGCATIHADHRRLSPELVAEIRGGGYPVLAYTVNDGARARRLFDWGVTSVFTDVPDIILEALAGDAPRPSGSRGAASSAVPRQGALR